MNVGLFVASQMPLLPSYVGAINQIPSATIQQVDFFSDPVGARRTINLWGAEASQGKIIDLLQPADLDGSTRMVAADIVYFKAPWLFPFDPSATTVRPFYINSVSAVDVPMMEATELLPHNHGKGATWIELPYARDPTGDHQIVMFIVMPERDFADFESNWNWELVQGALLELKQQPVHLVVPKWAFRFRENWNSILRRMGLGVAFSNRADFSGIDGAQDLALGNVIEETWISVDEQGTEAVSGSAASLMVKGIRMENPVEVVINRPFLFVIYDRSLGQVLFMGRVMSPAN
jgi:serpin B